MFKDIIISLWVTVQCSTGDLQNDKTFTTRTEEFASKLSAMPDAYVEKGKYT